MSTVATGGPGIWLDPPITDAIDFDVHVAPTSFDELAPYLDHYWLEYVREAEVWINGMHNAYPPGAVVTASIGAREFDGPLVPSTYAELADRVLDPTAPRIAVLNCLTLYETHRNAYYAAAMATAINEWLKNEFLDRDPRLRGSLLVSTVDPDDAVTEIERAMPDERFVQVLLPVRSDVPWGNKRNHKIFETARKYDLQIGLHAWGRPGLAPTPTGFTNTYFEDYLSNQTIAQAQILSLVAEGVFEKCDDLRVTLLECGFAWLPSMLWRFDKDWRGVWREVPWLRRKPSEYVLGHFKATTSPSFLPTDQPRRIEKLLGMVGTDWLLYSSDYPHYHGPDFEGWAGLLDDAERSAVLRGNAEAQLGLHQAR